MATKYIALICRTRAEVYVPCISAYISCSNVSFGQVPANTMNRTSINSAPAYQDNQQQNQNRTLNANDFIALVLQHVLPKGFRRVRDYGFLHGNAKQTLKRVQWALQVRVPKIEKRERPVWHCKHCGGVMHIIRFYRRRFDNG